MKDPATFDISALLFLYLLFSLLVTISLLCLQTSHLCSRMEVRKGQRTKPAKIYLLFIKQSKDFPETLLIRHKLKSHQPELYHMTISSFKVSLEVEYLSRDRHEKMGWERVLQEPTYIICLITLV